MQIGRPKINSYAGQLSYYFDQDNILRGTYSRLKPDETGGSKINIIQVGYQHNMSKRTRLWVEWMHAQVKAGQIETPQGEVDLTDEFDETNVNVVSTGIRHDF